MPKTNDSLSSRAINKFIDGLGKDIASYLGKEKACVVGLEDDGIFYAEGLYLWLKGSGKDVTFTVMDDYGSGLEEEKVKGRKIIIVDNDIVTGKAYRIVMKFIKEQREKLDIKDVKFAVLCDRMKLADFSIENYPAPSAWSLEYFDAIDLEIVSLLSQNGRKRFVEIAKRTGLTPVGVKNRVERLMENGILKIKAALSTEKFYSLSATIGVEASSKTVDRLIKKFENCPLVYNLVKFPTGHHQNLVIGLLSPNIERINDLVSKQLRAEDDIRNIEVDIGELPIVPQGHILQNFSNVSKKCPCENSCNECEYFLE